MTNRPSAPSDIEDAFIIFRSEWQVLESIMDDCGCDDGKRILYNILTEERDISKHDVTIHNQTLDELKAYCTDEKEWCDYQGDVEQNISTSHGYYARVYQLERVMKKIESLRTPSTQEHQK